MILFSNRMKIEKIFLTWCKEIGAEPNPATLVAYMQAKGWLRDELILADLKDLDTPEIN